MANYGKYGVSKQEMEYIMEVQKPPGAVYTPQKYVYGSGKNIQG